MFVHSLTDDELADTMLNQDDHMTTKTALLKSQRKVPLSQMGKCMKRLSKEKSGMLVRQSCSQTIVVVYEQSSRGGLLLKGFWWGLERWSSQDAKDGCCSGFTPQRISVQFPEHKRDSWQPWETSDLGSDAPF